MLSWQGKFIQIMSKINAFALRHLVGLDYHRKANKITTLFLAKFLHLLRYMKLLLLSEIIYLIWYDPSSRKKIVIIREKLSHLFEVLSQERFSGDQKHSRKMINSLVWLHIGQLFCFNSTILPEQVPICSIKVIVIRNCKIRAFLDNLFDDLVAASGKVNDNSFFELLGNRQFSWTYEVVFLDKHAFIFRVGLTFVTCLPLLLLVNSCSQIPTLIIHGNKYNF